VATTLIIWSQFLHFEYLCNLQTVYATSHKAGTKGDILRS